MFSRFTSKQISPHTRRFLLFSFSSSSSSSSLFSTTRRPIPSLSFFSTRPAATVLLTQSKLHPAPSSLQSFSNNQKRSLSSSTRINNNSDDVFKKDINTAADIDQAFLDFMSQSDISSYNEPAHREGILVGLRDENLEGFEDFIGSIDADIGSEIGFALLHFSSELKNAKGFNVADDSFKKKAAMFVRMAAGAFKNCAARGNVNSQQMFIDFVLYGVYPASEEINTSAFRYVTENSSRDVCLEEINPSSSSSSSSAAGVVPPKLNGRFDEIYANVYRHGWLGQEKNLDKAVEILKRMAEKSNAGSDERNSDPSLVYGAASTAHTTLASMCVAGEGPYAALPEPERLDQAFDHAKIAADSNDPKGHYIMGVLYSKKTPEDLKKSYEHYQIAASQGHPESQYNLGVFYFSGKVDGVPMDLQKAAQMFHQSAMQGFPLAQVNLGNMYVNGHGVERDLDKAEMWYTHASRNVDASGLLEELKELREKEKKGNQQQQEQQK